MNTPRWISSLVLVATLGAAATAADLPPVEIPVIAPLTGGVGFLGQSLEHGLQVLESHVNQTGGIRNRPLHFTFLDDQGQPQLSVQILNQLLTRNYHVILGSVLSANCRAMMPLVVDKGPVVYCLSPALGPPAGSYVFSAGVSPTIEMQATVHFFLTRGWTRLAILASTDASGSDADAGLLKQLALPENKAMQLVAHERFNPEELSVGAQISRIRAAGAQALIVWGAPNVVATAIHSISDSGLDTPTLVSDSIMVYSVMNQLNGFLPKQLYFASGGWAGISALKAGPQRTNLVNTFALLNAANIPPDAGSTEPWDAGAIVVEVLRRLGPDAPASAIRDAIASLHDYNGILGPYDFRTGDQRGLNASDVMIYRWLNDQREWRAVSSGGGNPLR